MSNARSTSISAPVGGLNDRDSIADMPPKDALVLTNWWPLPSYVQIRKGSANHVTGFANPVETLVEYLPTTGISLLFAASGSSIFDATTPGVVGAAVQTGLSNAQFQHANISTPGGSFLYLVNGIDAPRLWNNSTWTAITNASTPAITGVNPSLFSQICLYKSRLFFVENNSMRIWYLPVLSVGGAAQLIDVGSLFALGGRVEACYTWTIDAGKGSDDYFIIISSQGEVAVYIGNDPSSATDWRVNGVFSLGKPLGRRCGAKFGGDLVINTTEGTYPLSRALLSSTLNREVALTDKIQNSLSQASQTYSSNFGWNVTLFSDAAMLIVNVPAGNGQNFQYVQNTITGSWAKFEGWNASTWLYSSTGLYYGSSNAVVKAWVGNSDNGVPIRADCSPAFSYFGEKARNKYLTMVRPNILSTGNPSISYGLSLDFDVQNVSSVLNIRPAVGMTWGEMTWGTMVWGGTLSAIAQWNTVGAIANSAAIRLQVLNNGAEVRFTNVDYLYQTGGIL